MTALAEAAHRRSLLRRALSGLDGIAVLAILVTSLGMVVIVTVQVFMRYALNASLDWAEEVSRLLFVWSVFLAIPLGIKRGSHVSVELVTGWLPAAVQVALFRLVSLLCALLMGVVAWQGAILAYDQWDEPLTTIDMSVGLFLLPLVIGAAHSILHLLAGLADGPPPKRVVSE